MARPNYDNKHHNHIHPNSDNLGNPYHSNNSHPNFDNLGNPHHSNNSLPNFNSVNPFSDINNPLLPAVHHSGFNYLPMLTLALAHTEPSAKKVTTDLGALWEMAKKDALHPGSN